jgi:3-oxoacyl-[acyl-carrier-protein] synthase-3
MANCTAFQVALTVASDRMRLDPSLRSALIVGAAIVSRYLDWTDPHSCIYFGDGAGAAVIGRVPAGYGVLAHDIRTYSGAYEAVRLRGGGSTHPKIDANAEIRPYIEMSGIDVWKEAAKHQPGIIRGALEKAGLTADDVNFFVFHQANFHLISYLMGKMKQPMEKTHMNVERFGNTAEASMIIALTEAANAGKIKHGDIVVMSGVGAGFTFGATVMRWHAPRSGAGE